MRTILALHHPDPLLVGRLRSHRLGRIRGRPVLALDAWCPYCKERIRGRPVLALDAWCPYCKETHAFDWPDPPFGLDGVVDAEAPCGGGPLADVPIWVGLDPGRVAEHARLVRAHAASLRAWRSEERLRRQFAEARVADRKHRGERWDVLPFGGAGTAAW